MVGAAVAMRRALLRRSEARDGSDSHRVPHFLLLAFSTFVVCSDGYFDVYPPVARSNGDKPAYRGELGELGPGIRGGDARLAVRPDSAALADAVEAWSAAYGDAAVRGELGHGRDGNATDV